MCYFDYIISWYKNSFCRDEDKDKYKDDNDNYQFFPGDECEFCCCCY